MTTNYCFNALRKVPYDVHGRSVVESGLRAPRRGVKLQGDRGRGSRAVSARDEASTTSKKKLMVDRKSQLSPIMMSANFRQKTSSVREIMGGGHPWTRRLCVRGASKCSKISLVWSGGTCHRGDE